MMFPPAEKRETTLEAMNIEDVFGNGTRSSQQKQMYQLEQESVDTLFIIISDVQLDNPQVLEKLQLIFQGHEEMGNSPLFILIGTFVSKPLLSLGGREAYAAAFSALADVICTCPILAQTAKFLLVPGPKDYDICPPYPRKPIPDQFTEDLRKRVRHVTFTSNPARLRFFTQEIVIYREDLLRKFQRNSIVPAHAQRGITSASDAEYSEENVNEVIDDVMDSDEPQSRVRSEGQMTTEFSLVKSLIHQGHMCPLPLHSTPIYWEYDHAFRLTPLPHLVCTCYQCFSLFRLMFGLKLLFVLQLILANKQEYFSYAVEGCLAVNPGSFVADYSFITYRPATRESEYCQV
jgi:DNA polymerase epsilon subunit 2